MEAPTQPFPEGAGMTMRFNEANTPPKRNFQTVQEQAINLAQAAEHDGDWKTAELARILGDMAYAINKQLDSIKQDVRSKYQTAGMR